MTIKSLKQSLKQMQCQILFFNSSTHLGKNIRSKLVKSEKVN